MLDTAVQFILSFGAKYPIALSIFAVMGVARSVFKPLMLFADVVVAATPSQKDNEFLAKMKASKAYQGVALAMDYMLSIKLPGYDK